MAYSANVGGTGTIIGTPPNLILMDFMTSYTGHPLTFSSWMMFTLPDVLVNLGLVWIVLQLYFLRPRRRLSCCAGGDAPEKSQSEAGVSAMLREKYRELGPVTFHEGCTLGLFSLLVVIWFLRAPGFMVGWAEAVDTGVVMSSATPTLAIVILLFIIPAKPLSQPAGPALLVWEKVQRNFPWGIILLMGGGFALAEGAKLSCLSDLIGKSHGLRLRLRLYRTLILFRITAGQPLSVPPRGDPPLSLLDNLGYLGHRLQLSHHLHASSGGSESLLKPSVQPAVPRPGRHSHRQPLLHAACVHPSQCHRLHGGGARHQGHGGGGGHPQHSLHHNHSPQPPQSRGSDVWAQRPPWLG